MRAPTAIPCSEENRDATVAAATTAGILPDVADVKRSDGPVFIKTHRAGMQQVTPGERVKVWRTDGGTIVGKVVAASEKGIVIDVGGNLELAVPAPQIAQVYKAN